MHMALRGHGRTFGSLAEVMAKANEEKSGDRLAGLAAHDDEERVAAKAALGSEMNLKVTVSSAGSSPQ